MSRTSSDQLAPDGTVLNGFDYAVQVWVLNGICQDVGAGAIYAGQRIADVPGHQVRGDEDYNAEDYASAVWAEELAKADA